MTRDSEGEVEGEGADRALEKVPIHKPADTMVRTGLQAVTHLEDT